MNSMSKKISLLIFLGLCLGSFSALQATVYVNQIGYLPQQMKVAYTDHAVSTFSLIDVNSGASVFTGSVQLRKSDDPSTGLDVYEMDFSAFRTAGSYKIRLNDGEESIPFTVSDSVFAPVSRTVLKGLYFQRCGFALTEDYAGPYTHGSCHSADALFHPSCDTSGYKKTRGGWHDAGDYGKYVVPAANALSYLLMLQEYFPSYLNVDDLNIPESNNGLPDILDESRYELEWLLSMQDTLSGGVYFKVTSKDFVGFIMPDEDTQARYIYQIATTATGDFAAIMARAFRLFRGYDSLFADRCLRAAERAWGYLQEHPEIVPEGGFHNPDDTETGEYGDEDDSDERLWAAAELFGSTGEASYNSYFLNHYQENGIIEEQASWQYVKPLGQITYMKSRQSAVNPAAVNNIRDGLNQYASDQVTIAQNDGFHVAMEGWEYYWGSNSVDLNKAIILIFMYEENGNPQYYDVALHQLNYLMGCNAHNMTFATAVGTLSPKHIHHAPSAADGIDDPVPGLVVGGPNKYLEDPVLQEHFTANTPPALCYIDDQGSYASNEIAIYWNTPLVFVSAYFNHGAGGTSLVNRRSPLESFHLAQNYPNPFNNGTLIPFSLDTARNVQISVFDLAGKKVRLLFSGRASAGAHVLHWNGLDERGKAVASGIYFYRLKSGNQLQIKKMVLMR